MPSHCRPRAYDRFVSQLPHLEMTQALWRAAVAISMHELEDVDPDEVDRSLAGIVAAVRARVHSADPDALAAHLHAHLFDELGFAGNTEHYYDPANSYMPLVLDRRTGLPITLTLIYKCVAEGVGLTCHGVDAPWHFIASVHTSGGPLLVDPFHGGRTLQPQEAFEQMEAAGGATLERDERLLTPATHHRWLARICQNLIHVFQATGRDEDALAMHELQSLVV